MKTQLYASFMLKEIIQTLVKKKHLELYLKEDEYKK